MFEKWKNKRKEQRLDFLIEGVKSYNTFLIEKAEEFGFHKDFRNGIYIYEIVEGSMLLALRENHVVNYFEMIIMAENCDGIHVPIFLMPVSVRNTKKMIDHYIKDEAPFKIRDRRFIQAWLLEVNTSPLKNYNEIKKLCEELDRGLPF